MSIFSNVGRNDEINGELQKVVKEVTSEKEKICGCCDAPYESGSKKDFSVIKSDSEEIEHPEEVPLSVPKEFEKLYVGNIERCHEEP